MRLSNFYLFTIKEDPNDAYIASHRLMVRTGMIRQSSAGIYNWLPLGLLVLEKVKKKIREMHIECNINELLMPTIQSAELWKKSGRYEDYGKEMLKISDRNKAELLYGPTNEEQMTDIISKDLKSYKNIPKILYHFQWKFRDELRPRFGVMRGREFLMKDAYSFDSNYDNAYLSYCKMFVLYLNIFKSLGLKVLPYRADTGPIGGTLSHEFILESFTGESEIFFDKRAYDIKYNIDLDVPSEVTNVMKKFNDCYSCTLEKHNHEYFNKNIDSKYQVKSKGIEIGHIFYFGTKYSEKLNAQFIDKEGKNQYFHCGSYGIGISRLIGAIIEINNDDKGIKWPKEITPFHMILLNVNSKSTISTEFCEKFYKDNYKNIEILYDDKNDRIGHKLSNADLIGVPLQIIAGERNLVDDNVEIIERSSGKSHIVNKNQIIKFIQDFYEL